MVALTIVGGLVTSLAFTIVILGSWRFTPETWISDVTDNVEKTPVTRATVTWMVLIALTLVGGPIATAWLATTEHGAGFLERLVIAWCVVAIVNLVDLALIDIAIYLWMRPSWMTIEGYEMPTDYRMHVVGAVNGLVIGIPIAVIAAAVGLLA